MIPLNLKAQMDYLGEKATLAYSSSPTKTKQVTNSWVPYYTHIQNVENVEQKVFCQLTVGLGFLYLTNVSGNITLKPSASGSASNNSFVKNVGGFSYNRTPVFDLDFGYRFLDWFKMALAVQTQAGVSYQSKLAPSFVTPNTTRTTTASLPNTQFRANLNLDALYIKCIFELPWTMVWKTWMYAIYCNAGVGACWQSWTDIREYIQYVNNGLDITFVNTLNQKYGASAFWQIDPGFRLKSAKICSSVSILLGCRFNSWGKVPNLGAANQQGAWSYSFKKPYSARMLYSFVPYLGLQCNF